MKVVVVGEDGLIAPAVVSKFNEHCHPAVVASPVTSSAALAVDELAETFTGAEVVVDVANSPSYDGKTAWDFFYSATGKLIAAAKLTGVSHVVTLSVVGTGRLLASSYFRAKARQEQLITEAGIPFSIVRATQCYESLGLIADLATDGDSARISSALIQPIAAQDVASALTSTALGEPVTGIREVAGPHQYSLDEIVRAYLRAIKDDRRVLTDPQARYLGAKLDEHLLLPSRNAMVFPTCFAEWLARSMSAATRWRDSATPLT